jgi:Tfp pilus assembly protein PilP
VKFLFFPEKPMGTTLASRLILLLALFASSACATRKQDFGESFFLESLHYVGLDHDAVRAAAGEPPMALLRSECGAEFAVEVGNYIGKNDGRVMRFDEHEIVLREVVPDGNGQWLEREQRLPVEPGWQARPPVPKPQT